jgi:hypothetical protein
VSDDVDEMLADIEALSRDIALTDRVRAAQAADRAKLVAAARGCGVSLGAIADRMGVTREWVRRIAKDAPQE